MPIKPSEKQLEAAKMYEKGEIAPKKILENVIDASPILKAELERQGLVQIVND